MEVRKTFLTAMIILSLNFAAICMKTGGTALAAPDQTDRNERSCLMMEKIIDYLVNVRNQKLEVATKVSLPFKRHDDIRIELEYWIENQEFTKDNPLTIEGYTAEMIFTLAPFLDGVGVYNMMVALRECPERAKRMIAAGFPRK